MDIRLLVVAANKSEDRRYCRIRGRLPPTHLVSVLQFHRRKVYMGVPLLISAATVVGGGLVITGVVVSLSPETVDRFTRRSSESERMSPVISKAFSNWNGLRLIFAGLLLLIGPLFVLMGRATPVVESHPHWRHLDPVPTIFSFLFVGLSLYFLVDPIGFYCFFKRQPRNTYPLKYKRGFGAIAVGLVFLAVSMYLFVGMLYR